jgi:hypothetical protein
MNFAWRCAVAFVIRICHQVYPLLCVLRISNHVDIETISFYSSYYAASLARSLLGESF